MAILKLTTSSIEFDKAAFPHFSFNVKFGVSPSEGFTSNDYGGRKLAKELNERLTGIQVDLSCVGRERKNGVLLYDINLLLISTQEGNVLGELRDRFKDQIKFSVNLTPILASDRGCGPVISSEKMKINPIQNTCTRALPPLSEFLPHFMEMQDKWKLAIQIHVPENLALVGPMDVCVSKFDEPQLLQILHDQVFCDVNISAGNGAIIKAHMVYLAAASSVLRATLEETAKEARTGTLDLDMTGMSEEGVRAFLHYLYDQDLSGPSEDTLIAYELLYAAHKYTLPKLEQCMATLLEDADDKDFEVKLAFRLYSFVKLRNSYSSLKAKAIRILKSKWEEFETTHEYLALFTNGAKLDTAIAFFRDIVQSQMDHYDKPVPKTFSAPEKESTEENAPLDSGEMETEKWTDGDHDHAFVKANALLPDEDNDVKAGPCPCQIDLFLPSRPAKMTEIQVALEKRISELESALFHSRMEINHYQFKTNAYKDEITQLKMTIQKDKRRYD